MTTMEPQTITVKTNAKADLAAKIRTLKRMLEDRKLTSQPMQEAVSDYRKKLDALEDVYCFMISKR